GFSRGRGRGSEVRGHTVGQTSRADIQPRAFAMTRTEANASPEVVTEPKQQQKPRSNQ
ncbi:unnamed protein product, partial [Linum tenue]